MYNIRGKISDLDRKKGLLNGLSNEIDTKTSEFNEEIRRRKNEFEESIKPLNELYSAINEEYSDLYSEEVTVNLNDLVQEIALLSNCCPFNMGVEVSVNTFFWGIHTLKGIERLLLQESKKNNALKVSPCWTIKIYSDNKLRYTDEKQTFSYCKSYPLDFNEIQYDGKSMLEHCGVEVKYDMEQGFFYTKLIINKNLGSLNLKIKLGELVYSEVTEGYYSRWYPTDLMYQAVINYVERDNNKKHSDFDYRQKTIGPILKLSK